MPPRYMGISTAINLYRLSCLMAALTTLGCSTNREGRAWVREPEPIGAQPNHHTRTCEQSDTDAKREFGTDSSGKPQIEGELSPDVHDPRRGTESHGVAYNVRKLVEVDRDFVNLRLLFSTNLELHERRKEKTAVIIYESSGETRMDIIKVNEGLPLRAVLSQASRVRLRDKRVTAPPMIVLIKAISIERGLRESFYETLVVPGDVILVPSVRRY